MSSPEERLGTLGIELPAAVPGRPSVAPLVRLGDLVFVSSRGPSVDGDGRHHTGRHARSVMGVAELPNDYPVALDVIVAVEG